MVEELRIAPAADDTTLFTDILDLEVDRAGRVWVYDRPGNSIFLFAADGRLVRRIGREGGGPGEFRGSSGMAALPDSGMAIWDSRNARVSIFAGSGDLRTAVPIPAGFGTTDGLVSDPSGELWVKHPVSAAGDRQVIGRLGLIRVRFPGGFGDSLRPPELPVPRIEYFAERRSAGGFSRSSTLPEFGPRSLWGLHPGGYFVVADGGSYRILEARASGKPVLIERRSPPVPVSDEERDLERERITWSMRNVDPGWTWNGPALPETKSPLSGLFLARDGRIWAQVAVPSQRIPEAELDVPRSPNQPIRRFRTPTVYEVFVPGGKFLGRVALPFRSRLIEAEGNSVWALVRDADGLPAVVRYRVEPGW